MQVFELPEPKHVPNALGFAPDGRLLAVVCHGRVFVIDTVGGTVRVVWPDADSAYSRGSGLGFTADGRWVIVHHDLGMHNLVDVHDVERVAVARDFPLRSTEVCEPGPGGRLVYAGIHPVPGWAVAEIVRWNPLTGETLPPFGRHKSIIQRLAVSADEKWVAAANGDDVRVWNLGGKKLPSRATRQFTIRNHLVVALGLSADGTYVAAGSFIGLGGVFHVGEVRTGELWSLGGRPRTTNRDLAFHPSRPILALGGESGTVALYDAAARAELTRYEWPLEKVTALGFSPDGLRCAAAGLGKVVIWDVDV
jgi:WD40 repeat protein